jgi:TonB family protein
MKTQLLLFFYFSIVSIMFSQEEPLPPPIEVVEGPYDIEPTFPGGQEALMRFIHTNITYPESAIELGIEGKVYVLFYVEKDGKVGNVEILKGIACPAIEQEALRVVSILPNWIPGSTDTSLATRTVMHIPISFALEGDNEFDDPEEIKYEPHWVSFDLGFVSMFRLNEQTNSQFDTDFGAYDYWQIDPVKSVAINVNFLEYKLPIFKQYLGLTTGLGYGLTSLGLRNNYLIQHSNDTVFCVSDTIQSYKNNALAMHRLTLPLLLEFTTKPEAKKSFYLAAGIIGAWRFASTSTKTGQYANGDKFTNTTSSRFNLQHFSLDATVRAGFGKYLGAFVEYSLTPLFKKGSTIAIYPFRFGLSINGSYFSK